MSGPRILIVGGYGVVGMQAATLLAERNPQLEIWIGGRAVDKAGEFASTLPNARAVGIDLNRPDPLVDFSELPDVIIALANDDQDYLLLAAARRGIAIIDIARWTERMHSAIERLASVPITAPIILASGWMAGVTATVAVLLTTKLRKIDTINIGILYALKDKAGPNSLAYADRLNIPFTVQSKGRPRIVKPLSDPRSVSFSEGRTINCYRFDTPDQFTLVQNLGAAGVSSRLTYDDASTVNTMRFLLRSGLWSVLSWKFFTKLRQSILYNPGEGAPHEIIVEASGESHDRKSVTYRATIIDALGQTHMTAAGAVSQVERILALHERAVPRPGVSFPEQLTDHAEAITSLLEMGVSINVNS